MTATVSRTITKMEHNERLLLRSFGFVLRCYRRSFGKRPRNVLYAKDWKRFPQPLGCQHPVHVTARNIRAFITPLKHPRLPPGFLAQPDEGDIIASYKLVEYCQNPACERVFKALLTDGTPIKLPEPPKGKRRP